eukprot:4801-Heterococcus_DN1.PRE.1
MNTLGSTATIQVPPAAGVVPAPQQAVQHEEDAIHEEVDAEVFASYQCSSLTIGQPHPGDVAESSLLSAVQQPPATYPHDAFASKLKTKHMLGQVRFASMLTCHYLVSSSPYYTG